MKKIKFLSLILSVIMLMTFAAGCNGEKDPIDSSDESTPAETPAETPEATPAPDVTLTLASGGTCTYSVVRSENASDEVIEITKLVKNALADKSGAHVTITEDFLFGSMKPADYEILVGVTNREESEAALATMKYDDYTVSVVGNKIVIASYSEEQLMKAAEHFISMLNEADGTVTFSSADQLTYKHGYEVDDVKIDGKSLKGYKIIYARNASASIKTAAARFQKAILDVSGIYMTIHTDSVEETDKELLFGSTNRMEVNSSELGEYEYSIKTDGAKIVMFAYDNFTLNKAVDHVIELSKEGEIKAETGKLSNSAVPLLTAMCFSDVHNNFAMLIPNNNVGDYVVRRNVDRMIDLLLEEKGQVDVVLVGGDFMSDYPGWITSGDLPYEYYLGFKAKAVETFNRLAKDGKVMYVAGNHDYAQGELSGDGPGKNGSYNSFDFYFGEGYSMADTLGELPESEMYWKEGSKTGERYLLAYHYEVNGVHFIGFSEDHDMIWETQGYGYNAGQMEWLDNKLDEIDPNGTELIFVNCHYAFAQRHHDRDVNDLWIDEGVQADFEPILRGHRNLFYLYGHWHTYSSFNTDATVKSLIHYNTFGNTIDIKGDETESTEVIKDYETRSFTAVWMGAFRIDYSGNAEKFDKDYVRGGPYNHQSTATPKLAQGMYIEVYEDRVVFTMKNIGTWEGYKTEDVLSSYTVYLYK